MARRTTSDEEQALFAKLVSDAKPLRARARVTFPPKVTAGPKPVPPKPPTYVDRPAEPIGGHRAADLRRGRIEPEARIDLHGMTQDRAYRALIGFLVKAQRDDKRVALVITGKGGVLRGMLPLWLGQADLRPLVSGLSEAHARHGGSGAFYVSLRRRRGAR
jgi:DNA-nicking Smr family endonuclease